MIEDNINPKGQPNRSNLELLSTSRLRYHLTFDVDWAPDFCVNTILDKLNKANVKATFFVTHESDIIIDILNQGHEVGWHPNFMPNSSQGENFNKIMEYLFKIAPNASILRTHSLFQSSPLLFEIFSNYPQLKLDLSCFMYRFPFVDAFQWTYNDVFFHRINYNWADDFAFFDKKFFWNKPDFFGNTTVFGFHPIHIGLNSGNSSNYNRLKNDISKKLLWKVKESELKKYENYGYGARNFLDAILESDGQSIGLYDLL